MRFHTSRAVFFFIHQKQTTRKNQLFKSRTILVVLCFYSRQRNDIRVICLGNQLHYTGRAIWFQFTNYKDSKMSFFQESVGPHWLQWMMVNKLLKRAIHFGNLTTLVML